MYTSKSNKEKSPLTRLLSNLKSQKRLIYSAIICSTLNKFFDLAPPVLIGISVDVVVRKESSWLGSIGFNTVPDQLIALSIISFLIWTAESFFEYLYGLMWRNLAQKTQHYLRIKAYDHLQKLEMTFFESDNTGRLMTVLNDDINQLERFLDEGANKIIQLIITVFIVGGAMILLAPGIALLAFIPIPFILWGSIRFQKNLAPRYREVRDRAGDLASRLNNNLSGMLTIKSFATEDWELERLRLDSNLYQESNRKAIKLSAAFIPLIRFAILFAFLAILIAGGFQSWKGLMPVGTYSFLVFITQRLLWPLTTLGHILDDYQRSMASTNRVLDLIDTPIKIKTGKVKLDPCNVKGAITFNNIDFTYEGRSQVIKNFNLDISPGKKIGIVGATGSGKSTLIKLLLRLYKISKGSIEIDNNSIESLDLNSLRRCIALVIKNAADIAEATEFINQLPQGLNTIVGERGQKLSGGQRQRIAIARAILKNAPILVLDEATASVDNETEAAIQRSLKKITTSCTTIVIAHRLSTVIDADEIIVLDKGKIIEKGTHHSLLKNRDFYYHLWKIQAGGNNT